MSTPPDLGFVHRFVPAPGGPGAPTLLLLHGTGGNEDDLLPLGRAVAPQAALLSPRGKVLEGAMPRFFRRLAGGVFDHEDLILRTHELAGFLERAVGRYGIDPARLIALGFSNGANIAASLLLLHPGALRAAVLLRPMIPFEPDPPPDLSGVSVLVAAGRMDAMVPPAQTERLAAILASSGADVEVHWADAGHGLLQAEVDLVRSWLERRAPAGG